MESAELESLKKSIQLAETIRSDLTSKKKRNDSDAKGIQKMADEYLNLYKDIKKRIKTLKQYYLKHASPRSVRWTIIFSIFLFRDYSYSLSKLIRLHWENIFINISSADSIQLFDPTGAQKAKIVC